MKSDKEAPVQSSAVTISDEAKPATMGVSRIWTSASARRNGVARKMLNCATDNFLYGMRLSKKTVAFSQPTESGGSLARRWFGKECGWLVYCD